MYGRNLHILMTMGSLLLLNCCSRENKSVVLADTIDIHPDIVQPLLTFNLSCPDSAMVFLIGSSEIISTVEKWDIFDTGFNRSNVIENQIGDAEKFKLSINKAKSDLIKGFQIDPKCKNDANVAFIAITDHYQANDSAIDSYIFKKTNDSWKIHSRRSWQLSGGSLVAEKGRFEMDTSIDVAQIVRYFASNKIRNIESAGKLTLGTESPGQISYIIKTNGGRVATNSEYLPRLDNLTQKPRANLDASDWEPAFLIDRIGKNGPLESDVFSAHWTEELIRVTAGEPGPSGVLAGDPGATSGDPGATSGEPGATSGDSGATAGDGSPPNLSGDHDATSGDKSLSYKEGLVRQDSSYDYLGRKNWGAYATYGSSAKNSITLPVPGKKTSPTGVFPKNLIIMDTCLSSKKILQALQYSGQAKGNTVVLASSNQIYFEFLDYSNFNTGSFLKFPALLEKLEKNVGLTPSEKNLRSNLLGGTLDWRNDDANYNSNFKRMEIWLD